MILCTNILSLYIVCIPIYCIYHIHEVYPCIHSIYRSTSMHSEGAFPSDLTEALLVRGAEVKAPHEDTAAAGLPRRPER